MMKKVIFEEAELAAAIRSAIDAVARLMNVATDMGVTVNFSIDKVAMQSGEAARFRAHRSGAEDGGVMTYTPFATHATREQIAEMIWRDAKDEQRRG